MQLSGSGNKVNIYKDTAISGNLEVDKVLTLKRIPGISDTPPLVIINDSPGGGYRDWIPIDSIWTKFQHCLYYCSKFSCVGRRC